MVLRWRSKYGRYPRPRFEREPEEFLGAEGVLRGVLRCVGADIRGAAGADMRGAAGALRGAVTWRGTF